MIVTQDVSSVTREAWDVFIKEHPEGNVFQSYGMYNTYLAAKNYEPLVVFAINDNGSLAGILMAVIQREKFYFIRKITSRAIVTGGPLAYSPEVIIAMLKVYDGLIRKKAVYTQVRNFTIPDNEMISAFRSCRFDFEDHLNIKVDLTITPDMFWKGIKKNRRDGINKAKRNNFSFRVSKDPDTVKDFYTLLEGSYRKYRLPYPDRSFFSALALSLHEELYWFILEHEDKSVVILVALLSKDTLYAYYIGTTQSEHILNLRPVDLLYYNIMSWCQQNGARSFDWMGAGRPDKEYGVRYFKQQYGGVTFNPGRFQAVHRPLLMMLGRTGFNLLQLTRKKQ